VIWRQEISGSTARTDLVPLQERGSALIRAARVPGLAGAMNAQVNPFMAGRRSSGGGPVRPHS
jgi:hypothetical protein